MYVQHPILTTFQLILFITGFFIGTVYLSPDMDTKSEPSRRCGIACTPYRKLFTHRGISHHWLWGTATRIIYVLLLIGLLSGLIFVLYPSTSVPDITVILSHPFEILMFILGLFISNVLHTITDILF